MTYNLQITMKALSVIFCMFLLAGALVTAGCQPGESSPGSVAVNEVGFSETAPCSNYAPVKIDIAPLTEFVPADKTHRQRIDLYVSLLDSFGSQVKSPGRFRFELYERVQRSAEPKGKRIAMWPELDLTDPVTNNEYWRDFLRAYEFTLPIDQSAGDSHILQVTYFCPSGRRIASEFILSRAE